MLTVLQGDALEVLKTLASESVQCCVTSPPYWGLRDYGTAEWDGGDVECDHRFRDAERDPTSTLVGTSNKEGFALNNYRHICGKCGAKRIDSQLGLEPTPELYVERMVEVFREVRRVLRKDGTLWLNLGDSYTSGGRDRFPTAEEIAGSKQSTQGSWLNPHSRPAQPPGLKPKDLVGIPWRVAFALQADGWYLRSDIIWAKPNPMPESVTDRPTKAHEYVFLLTKSAHYFYDAEAIREPLEYSTLIRDSTPRGRSQNGGGSPESLAGYDYSRENLGDMQSNPAGRNKRSVWSVPTSPYPDAHFATYPPSLIKPMILAGTSARGCCAHCGAPWERIVQAESADGRTAIMSGGKAYDDNGKPLHGDNMIDHGVRGSFNVGDKGVLKRSTLGWQPTCSCNSTTTPCTVLDPFAGSGTTGQVAIELSRKAILIELNPTYVKLIEQRCSITIGLPLA